MSLATLSVRTVVTGLAEASGSETLTDDAAEIANPSVPAAVTGTLSTRTSDTAGTLTMTGGHGIITGQRVDLYWDGGAAYGIAVGTVSVNSVPFTSAAGDVMPAQTTAITVGKATQVAFDVEGDDVSAILLSGQGSSRAYFVFDGGSDVAPTLLAESGPPYVWNGVGTNPLAGETITSLWISHDYTAGAKTTLQAVALRH